MEEKKLTDKKIIIGLENWVMQDSTAKVEDLTNAIEFILQLQAENEELKSPKFGNWKVKFFKAQAEIERLTEETKRLKSFIDFRTANVMCDKCKEQAVKDTAEEIFEKIFEALCCFSTKGKSNEYNEGYIQAIADVDERIQKVAKEKGVEVE